jgi:hypothetical protein
VLCGEEGLFSEDMLAQIKMIISEKMESLVDVLIQRDKVQWFEKLLVEDPSDAQLDYVDDVFGHYMKIISYKDPASVTQKDLVHLCKKVLKVSLTRPQNLLS